jgi:hypothetical protein
MNRTFSTASVCLMILIGFAAVGSAPAAAFHGSWWKGYGTAVSSEGLVFAVEFYWGGQDAILQCGGGGCQGTGDGKMTFLGVGGTDIAGSPFAGTEDVRNILFTNDPVFCPSEPGFVDPLEVTPNYSLVFSGGSLSGIQRNCLSSGNNRNDFTGTFLDMSLTIHAEGPFGVSHG